MARCLPLWSGTGALREVEASICTWVASGRAVVVVPLAAVAADRAVVVVSLASSGVVGGSPGKLAGEPVGGPVDRTAAADGVTVDRPVAADGVTVGKPLGSPLV